MDELLNATEIIAEQIKKQRLGLESYICREDWKNAAEQAAYIAGMQRSLNLLLALVNRLRRKE